MAISPCSICFDFHLINTITCEKPKMLQEYRIFSLQLQECFAGGKKKKCLWKKKDFKMSSGFLTRQAASLSDSSHSI